MRELTDADPSSSTRRKSSRSSEKIYAQMQALSWKETHSESIEISQSDLFDAPVEVILSSAHSSCDNVNKPKRILNQRSSKKIMESEEETVDVEDRPIFYEIVISEQQEEEEDLDRHSRESDETEPSTSNDSSISLGDPCIRHIVSKPAPTSTERLSWVKETEEGWHYTCMFEDCRCIIKTDVDLSIHFEEHTKSLAEARQDGQAFTCSIRQCDYKSMKWSEWYRHLTMHFYHAYSQKIGGVIMRKKTHFMDIDDCKFPSSLTIFYDGEATNCLWDKCNACFNSVIELFNHITLHIDMMDIDDRIDGMFICRWQQCHRSFAAKGDLRKHLSHHSGSKYCACPYCGQFFARIETMYNHLIRRTKNGVQQGVPVLECTLCGKEFADEKLFAFHTSRHIVGQQCPMCGVMLGSPSELEKHILNKHTQDRPRNYGCQHCELTFYTEIDVNKHMAIHEAPKFVCAQCGMMFKWKKQLVSHERTHDQNCPARAFACHLCDKTYSYSNGLTKHLSIFHACPMPDGFSKFMYKKCTDNMFRLMTRKLLRISK